MELWQWFAVGFVVSSFWTFAVFKIAYYTGYRKGATRVLDEWKEVVRSGEETEGGFFE